MADPYVRTEFKIVAVISGVTFEDIISISATFGLNSIPTASLQVATGKNVRTGAPATIHAAIAQLKPRSKAKVTLTVKTNDGRKEKMMPDGEYVIFDGYYAGVGYQRAHTSAVCTIHLLHWLDDLNCSSMLNGNWFQGAPHDMAQAASQFSLRAGASGEANIAPIIDAAPKIITVGNMEKGLWDDVLKPIFQAVSEMPHPLQQSPDGQGGDAGGVGGGNNKAAQDALKRMPGDAPVKAETKMNLGGLSDITVPYSVNMGISHMVLNGMAYSSFWGKLIGELGASFLLGVSPGVTFANVIPYFSGLSTPWKTIEADEYNYASFNCSVANLIESVDIFYAQQSSSGYDVGGTMPTPMSYYHPWGRFPERNREFRGHILVRDPPAWIANATPQSIFTPWTTLSTGIDSHDPQKGPASTPEGAPRAPEAEKKIKDAKIITNFCEHWFKSAVLGQRYGELSGKLRFDIAPGSIVKIMASAKEISGTDMPLYAAVTQVSYVINAEQHVAGTSFNFTSIRNEQENQNTNLVSAVPPLYTTPWSGGPLTEPLY